MKEPSAELYRPAWVEVDLGRLEHNLQTVRATAPGAAVLAVVKADGYGHGAVETARTLERAGVDWLGVALVSEAAELRAAGLRCPILVLGLVQEPQMQMVLDLELTPVVASLQQLAALRGAVPDTGIGIHLKLDTGMHRLGVPRRDWAEARAMLDGGRLRLEGVLSHLAETTSPASPANDEQEQHFREALTLFGGEGAGAPPWVHVASSAAALHRASARHNLVRIGLALYGYDPAAQDCEDPAPQSRELEAVMSVWGEVIHVVEVEAGESVGYGRNWRAERASRIGVVPVGYADGMPWRLGGRGAWASVDGKRVPIVGQVNMDMVQVDLTDTTADVGDRAVLLGGRGTGAPDARALAACAGTSIYEVLCRFGHRLPRRCVFSDRDSLLVAPRSGALRLARGEDGSGNAAT
jgi:alanine racemase